MKVNASSPPPSASQSDRASQPSRAGTFRIALVDPGNSLPDWVTALIPGQAVQTIRCATVEELGGSRADLALICSSPASLRELLGEVAVSGLSVPVAALTGDTGRDHPMVRLMWALGKAKLEWEAAFDALTDPLALLDADGRVVRANLGFARGVGRDIRDVVGCGVAELLGPPREGGEDEPVARSLLDGRPRTAEVSYANLQGPHLASLSPLPLDEKGHIRFVLLIKDLTEQKQQQQRLFQAARLADVGHLAAGVAHEINTPLASIALRAESLRRSAEDPSLRDLPGLGNLSRYLSAIENDVDRCKKIVRALLEFSSRQEPTKRLIDLNTLVESAAQLVGHQMRLRRVRFETRVHRDLPSVAADEAQLRQVLVALLMNALAATSAGGCISVVTTEEAPGHVVLAVEDDGVGIPREVQDKIWSPFFSTKPLGQGTGLGLAICHGLVTAHGGSIELDSEPGRGTRVRVRLPVAAPVTLP